MHVGYWWERQKEGDHYEEEDMWVDNIKMDRIKLGWGCMEWIDVA
jgi:hypothetical protein